MKGILFKPDMIQAIIEGRKTQTRRLIKPQPRGRVSIMDSGTVVYGERSDYLQEAKPRYHIGETVYLKEAWAEWIGTSEHLASGVISLEEAKNDIIYKLEFADWNRQANGNGWVKKSVMMMPEWAARYFIVIEQVRAERVQEIIYGDCLDEGITAPDWNSPPFSSLNRWEYVEFIKKQYRLLWNTINPKYPFESNPWVFPYTFRLKEGK